MTPAYFGDAAEEDADALPHTFGFFFVFGPTTHL